MLVPLRAAACRTHSRTVLACPRHTAFSPLLVMPVLAARASARVAARMGSSQPSIGSHATRCANASPSMPCGSNTPTGPRAARARRVALMLSGFVEVVTTAPGASRIALMARCRPLPEPGGPTTRMLRSHDAHTASPAGGPEQVPDVGGRGLGQRRSQGAGLRHERRGGGDAADGLDRGPAGPGVEPAGALACGGGVTAACAQHPARQPRGRDEDRDEEHGVRDGWRCRRHRGAGGSPRGRGRSRSPAAGCRWRTPGPSR